MRWQGIVGAGIVAVGLSPCSGSALAQGGSSKAILQSFEQCRVIPATDARLDCFDKAAQALARAVQTKDVTIVDRQDVRTAQRSLFGLSLAHIPLFGGGDERDRNRSDAFEELDSTVTAVQPLSSGGVQLRLAEGGAVWVTTDPMPFPPRVGAKVKIKRGALGNFFINVEGQRSVRGTRLR